MKLIEKKLKNGIKVIYHPHIGESVAVNVLIGVGSFDDPKSYLGISHFIEHMSFEGTNTRSAMDISCSIEGLGGEINAYTTNEKTCYSIKVLKKHIDSSLEILSDIIKNPKFEEDKIEKERRIILSEISMRDDQPIAYQWDLFLNAAFNDSIIKIPVIGMSNTIKNIKKDDLNKFHKDYYVPNNMIISVVGDIKNPFSYIEKYFGDMNPKFLKNKRKINYSLLNKKISVKKKKDISQTYMIIGYPTIPIIHKDCLTLELIRAILGKGLSGRLFNEIRNKKGLGYDIGVHHEASPYFGFFSCYVSADKKNILKCKEIILNELKKAPYVCGKELIEAKNFLEGEVIFDNEANHRLADTICGWAQADMLEKLKTLTDDINNISSKDIERVAKKYLTDNYALAQINSS
jgi:predicted Zn-dependent peptidase